jgi:hypothetical protein
MNLITTNTNLCLYHGTATHSFDDDGILTVDNVKYSEGKSDNIVVYDNVNVPEDFTCFKYSYDGEQFSLSGGFLKLSEEQRTERNTLLAETDWWAVSDRTMTQAEIDYRQALRDVPAQDGFPLDITWPTKPE